MIRGANFYIHAKHGVGGVTSWSYQSAKFLQSRWQTEVVAIGNESNNEGHADLFPSPPIPIRPTNLHNEFVNEIPQRENTLPKLTKKKKHPLTAKSKNPILPTLEKRPARSTIAPNEKDLKNSKIIREMIINSAIHIPNYLNFGYRMSAFAQLHDHNARCVGVCHTDAENYYRLLSHYEPCISKFVAVSNKCFNTLAELIPHRIEDIRMIPYGVKAPEKINVAADQNSIRLLYAGRIQQHQKRIMDLVALVDQLRAASIPFYLDTIGEGPERQAVIDAFSGDSSVRVLDPVSFDRMMDIYPKYNILILTSAFEGTSITMLEAMSHGLAPLVTNVSGACDVIQSGKNGYLYNISDMQTAAAHIAELVRKPDLLRSIQRSARSTALNSYSTDRQLSMFEDCLIETSKKESIEKELIKSILEKDFKL